MKQLLENRWAFVPVALLSATVISGFLMVSLSMGDGGATAVEPDYYRKAAAWDEVKEQRTQNGYLNWVVTPAIVASPQDPFKAQLELTVADKFAVNIASARVTVELFPLRDADRRCVVECREVAPGRYAAQIPLRISGQWEFRVRVESKDRVYTDCFRRMLRFERGSGTT